MLLKQIFATKSLKVLLDEMAGDHQLKRVLGPWTLTSLGVGAVIGAGIFVATGAAAHAKNLKNGKGFVAIFDGKRAAVLVWLRHKDDGSWKLAVGSFAGKWCKGTEIANPTVNTPVSPDATKGCDGKWRWDFWGWGWRHQHHQHGHGEWAHHNGDNGSKKH